MFGRNKKTDTNIIMGSGSGGASVIEAARQLSRVAAEAEQRIVEKPEDTRDLFTRNLDSMAKMLNNWQKRREYLEAEILRLSEELYQVNVSTEAVKTAQQMILDHRSPTSSVEEETAAFEAASAAVTDVLADVAQGSAAYDDPDVIAKLEEAVVTANLTGRRANHKAPADASAK